MPETNDRLGEAGASPRNPGFFRRIGATYRGLGFFKELSFVTLLSSAIVGYFQYLNAYQEKVSSQAKEDLKSVSEIFGEISGSFSNVLAQQQILYSDFAKSFRTKSGVGAQALASKNALEISKAYEKARTELHEKIDVLARKAELQIDRASDADREPAAKRNVEDDPMSLTLLRSYRFNCSDSVNFPHFGNVYAAPGKPTTDIPDEKFCASERKQGVDDSTTPPDAFIRICPANRNGVAHRIYWFSAKHHVLTMHYCFEAMHARLEPVRQWASQSDRDTAGESEIVAQTDEITAALDGLAQRLNSFNSLALFQMERMRVKYRPAGFECSIPGVRNLYARSCLPLQTTTARIKDASR